MIVIKLILILIVVINKNSICDFMNITRVYSPSPNKDYLNVLKNNEKAVFKKSEISKIFINHKI